MKAVFPKFILEAVASVVKWLFIGVSGGSVINREGRKGRRAFTH